MQNAYKISRLLRLVNEAVGYFFLCLFSLLCFGRSLKQNFLILHLKIYFFFSEQFRMENKHHFTISLLHLVNQFFKLVNVSFYFYRCFHFSPRSGPSSLQKKKKEHFFGLGSTYTVFNLYQGEYLPPTRLPFTCVIGKTFTFSNIVTDGMSANLTDLTAPSASRFPKYHFH